MSNKKKRPFQEIFLEEKTSCKTEEKILKKEKLEVSLKKAVQRENFKSLFCMQKTGTFCKKLPKEGESSKAS